MIHTGIDVVQVARLEAALERWPRLAERLFTDDERRYAAARPHPVESLAARFAAKEATMKALGVGLGAFGFHDVEVVRASSGKPSLKITGAAADLARAQSVTALHLSITHTDSTAEAVVIAE